MILEHVISQRGNKREIIDLEEFIKEVHRFFKMHNELDGAIPEKEFTLDFARSNVNNFIEKYQDEWLIVEEVK